MNILTNDKCTVYTKNGVANISMFGASNDVAAYSAKFSAKYGHLSPNGDDFELATPEARPVNSQYRSGSFVVRFTTKSASIVERLKREATNPRATLKVSIVDEIAPATDAPAVGAASPQA